VPEALEDATDAQSQLSKLEGADANAWKVAKSPGGSPVAAPLHPYLVNPLGAVLPWRKGTKIEVEIAVELGLDLPVPTERSYERAEILAAISNVYLGAEMVWSCISEGGSISYPAFLADRLGNLGYVRGPTLPLDVLQPGSDFPLTLLFNGRVAFDAAGQYPTKDPLTWLSDYASNRSRSAAALKAGAIISTGSLFGAIEVPGPGDVSIQLGEHAVLRFELRERERQGA
jgi:2-keto-4-pentenoate hydratase